MLPRNPALVSKVRWGYHIRMVHNLCRHTLLAYHNSLVAMSNCQFKLSLHTQVNDASLCSKYLSTNYRRLFPNYLVSAMNVAFQTGASVHVVARASAFPFQQKSTRKTGNKLFYSERNIEWGGSSFARFGIIRLGEYNLGERVASTTVKIITYVLYERQPIDLFFATVCSFQRNNDEHLDTIDSRGGDLFYE